MTQPPKRPAGTARRVVADALTGSRVVVALALVAGPQADTGAVFLVAWAWASDTADGPLARSADRLGHLGRLDHAVDAAVALAMIWFLGDAGAVPVLATRIGAVVLLGAWAVTRVMAAQMLLQTAAGAQFMWWAMTSGVTGWWLLPTVALAVLALEWPRFVGELVPAFLTGWSGLLGGARRHIDHS